MKTYTLETLPEKYKEVAQDKIKEENYTKKRLDFLKFVVQDEKIIEVIDTYNSEKLKDNYKKNDK